MNRISKIERESLETKIAVEIDVDGDGIIDIDSGIGFLDHMLTLFAIHGKFDLDIKCEGDLEVDGHHTVEDLGIVLGQAFRQALGSRKGISRYGSIMLPMDETLVIIALDISGRPYLHYETPQLTEKVGNFDTELIEEFFRSFSSHLGLTLHIKILHGSNTHHMIEAIFKAVARALKKATNFDNTLKDLNIIPSSKGILD